MNSTKHASAETRVGQIQYPHPLFSKPTQAPPTLSLAGAKTFRIPLVTFTRGANLGSREADQPKGPPAPTATTGTHNGARPPADGLVTESLDFMPEQLRRRWQTKTIAMEEALQRSEWSQRRFWGINE